MLFVNDLYVPGVPSWLTHSPDNFDGMGLADWVFPGFLFMVGMAVPFDIQSRIKKGDSNRKLVFHIFLRTISLLIIGVLLLNVERINSELTGIPKYLWAILVYICIFLIWNFYGNWKNGFVFGLKGLGIAGLGILLAIYKAGTPEEITWIAFGWWGILGPIACGYLLTSLVYMTLKDNLIGTLLVWLGFVGINILYQIGLFDFPNYLYRLFGVFLTGNVPAIVMAGLFFSLVFRKFSKVNYNTFIINGIILGVLSLVIGFVLRNWYILSQIMKTPSHAMVCNGISILFFILLFLIIDVLGKKKWTIVFKPAGQNSLTTYLAPNVLYYAIWWSGVPILFYKQSELPIVAVLGSILWALLMMGFTALLSKIGIRLKL